MKIFGIDQTGAVINSTTAKPLKACELILTEDHRPSHVHFFEIKNLSEWLSSLKHPSHIFIDCVLGLPYELYLQNADHTLRDWIQKAGSYTYKGKHFGRDVAENFFNDLKAHYKLDVTNNPKRDIETRLNSNSVFTSRPFQKNIQTGTFRIWKELSFQIQNIILWPTDFYLKEELQITLYEVYPSYFYKSLLGVSFRNPEPLINYLKMQNINCDHKSVNSILNPDFADALMAALGGFKTITDQNVWSDLSDNDLFEGNILGSM